jgi:hypothetical protein
MGYGPGGIVGKSDYGILILSALPRKWRTEMPSKTRDRREITTELYGRGGFQDYTVPDLMGMAAGL